MKCAVGLCGHCQFGPHLRVQGRPGLPLRPRRPPSSTCGRSERWPQTAAEARRLEVRLVRRLPAQPARLRGRAARARRRGRHRLLPGGDARRRCAGPYDLSLVEGSITTPHDAERIREVRRASRSAWSRSAPAPPPAASRRCATSATSRSSSRVVYATPGVHRHARHLDADRRARAGRLRAARLPDRQAPAPRGDRARSCTAARPNVARAQRLRRVQAARQRVRDGRARHALPRAGHARRAAARSARRTHRGCYGCFGPMETPNTRRRSAARCAAPAALHASGDSRARVPRRFNAERARRFRDRQRRRAMTRQDVGRSHDRRASRASRARAR